MEIFDVSKNLRLTEYRKDIDGLRAIAVIAVIINHLNKNLLENGYLGVDIFFVISGFVITRSLLLNSKEQKLSDFIIDFYQKRIKRIVPALIFFVLIMSLLIFLFIPLPGPSLKTGIFSLIGLSNIFLYNQSIDYFASSADLNIFTNTWSLGVEEQFYIVYPFLFWFIFKKKNIQLSRKYLIYLMSSISFISFVSFIYFYYFNFNAAYYLTPMRFWEMGLGCLSGLIMINNFSNNIGNIIKKIICSITFLTIILCFFLNFEFGLFSTILITFSTFLLILFSEKQFWTEKLLVNKLFRNISSYSYSLYLWHWGIISLFRWTFSLNNKSIIFASLIFSLLAIFSYHFIENPFRKGTFFNNKILEIVACLSGIFLTSISIVSTRYLSKKWPYFPTLFREEFISRKSIASSIGCMGDESPWKCLKRESETSHAFLLGDSHMMGYVPSIKKSLIEFNFKTLYWGGIKHIRDIFSADCSLENCLEDINELELILDNNFKQGDIIIYSLSRNRLYGNNQKINKNKFFDGNSRRGTENIEGIELLKNAIQKLVDYVQVRQGKFILIDGPPVVCNKSEWIRSTSIFNNSECLVSSKISLDDRSPLTDLFLSLVEKNNNLYYLDPHKILCPKKDCTITLNDKPLYSDNSPHLSWESRYILKDFITREFKRILN